MGVELRHRCNSAREGRSAIKREWLADYNRRTEQRCSRSNWETLLAFMPSVFPLQPSCHVAYCSSDSWSPQSRSLLAWNLCDGYKKGKPWIIKGRREANIKDMGGSETAQQPDKLSHERGGIGWQHVSDGCVTMPLANAILFVLVLRQMVILHLSGCYSR